MIGYETQVFTVVDVETTGLNADNDHITEIAAIRAVMTPEGTLREIGRFQTLVSLWCTDTLTPEVVALTGIHPEMLVGAPNEMDALLALEAFAACSTIVAHNAPFDLAFISRVFEPESFVCTRAMTKIAEPDESASLKNVCERHHIPLVGHHSAMNDVLATVEVFEVMRRTLVERGIPFENVVIDSEERPLNYVPPGATVRMSDPRSEYAKAKRGDNV